MMTLRPGNPMQRALVILLSLQMMAFGLAIPIMIRLAGMHPVGAVTVVGGTALLCLVSAGVFRTAVGYPLGWLAQLAGLALGFWYPVLFFVAGIFTALYVLAFGLGKKIDHLQRRVEATSSRP